jgi:insulysin
MLSPRYWIFLIIVLTAVGYSMIRLSQTPEVISSDADPYSYQYMQLENGLKVLLVNTPDADKASAAMSVSVGSMDDPDGREGLAHFLEHMLFLGTEPYPEPDEYQQFIKQNGGSHNAFTSYAQTTYFFDIDNEQLPGALDRFSPFFISPTFDAAYVDREKNAVNAEYSSNLKEDGRRIYSAQKMAMNPDFGFSHFSTGNLDTLADRENSAIRDELISFYKTHYSSDRMTLVIAGDYDLDQLSNWARGLFSDIPQREVHFSRPNVPVFVTDQLPMDMNIEPVKELRQLKFMFPLPEIKTQYAYKPVSLITNLIGHEGEGSILALLKEKGWAESLSAGRGLSTDNASTMSVSIGLTKLGLLHIEEITAIFMHYVDLLKANGIPDYLKKEQALQHEMMFRFQEHGQISNYVTRLSSNMLIFPVEDTIYGDYRTDLASDALLKSYLSNISADNMLRTLVAPGVETDTIDPWYDTPIRIRPSSFNKAIEVADLNQLHLPEANPFIPENLTLNPGEATDIPVLLEQAEGRQVWYYAEHDFEVPKAQVLISLQIPDIQTEGRQRLLAKLYTRAVNEALNTYSYPATLAGLNYRLSATEKGLEVAVGGYYDKLPVLLERVFETMQNVEVSDDEFSRYKASLQRNLENNLKARPFQRTVAELKNFLIDPSFSDTDLLPLLSDVTLKDVQAFAAGFDSKLASVTYVHGAMSAEDAQQLGALVSHYYPARIAYPATSRLVHTPKGKYQQEVSQDHPDKVMTLYIQGTDSSDLERAEFGLLAQMISSPYYQYMRTEQQLGYIVFATALPQKSVPALAFIVQSPEASPEKMMEHTDIFFRQYASELKNIDEKAYDLFRQGLITRLLEKPKNMSEKAGTFWGDLITGRYAFDTRESIAEQVATIPHARIINLYQQTIMDADSSWLLYSKGSQDVLVEGFEPLSTLDRAALPRFAHPESPLPTAIIRESTSQ